MSLSVIFGVFCLTGGYSTRAASKSTPSKSYGFIMYDTTIQFLKGQVMPASLRVYQETGTVILPTNTVVILTAKFSPPSPSHASTPNIALLDAIQLFPFPGDPTSPDYQLHIPKFEHPLIFGVGNVSAPAQVLPDGQSRVFGVSVSDYVRDQMNESSLQCVFEARARWANTPSPLPSSCVGIVGLCHSMSTTNVCVTVNHIALNARPHDAFNQLPNTSLTTTPTTKRTFNAVVPLNSAPPVDITAAFGSPTNNTSGPSNAPVPPVDIPPASKKTRTSKPKSTAGVKATQKKKVAPKKAPSAAKPKSTRAATKAAAFVATEAEDCEEAEEAVVPIEDDMSE